MTDSLVNASTDRAKLILASGSPRRKELLEQIGVSFQVQSTDIDESVLPDESPEKYVTRLSAEKALAVFQHQPDKVVLAADTSVVINGRILGKPTDTQDAVDTLKMLSGQSHQVLTGVSLIAKAGNEDSQQKVETIVTTTQVHFLPLSEQDINEYVATGEPMDKAGSYGIQGKAALFVDRIEGSYSNVVGLPLAQTGVLLKQFGIAVLKN